MKKTLPAFLAGVIATLAVLGSAYAITTNMTIEVWPINILINGETFQPYDVNGTEVPVFVYNGTTYAPLRALAEAYGLVVGYDGEKNQATVSSPEYIAEQERLAAIAKEYTDWDANMEIEYEAFKEMWKVVNKESGRVVSITVCYNGDQPVEKIMTLLINNQQMMERYRDELNTDNAKTVDLTFCYGDRILGHAVRSLAQSIIDFS